jgi:hypothetical protein
MGEFHKDRLPDAAEYFDLLGLKMTGRGKWRTTSCEWHGGSDSMRVNVESGAWRCMNCGVHGGDILAYHMQRHGLDFVDAAKALGAWVDDGTPHERRDRPRSFSARDALEVIEPELNVCLIVIADARNGITPTPDDWNRFLQAAGRIQAIAGEAAR